MKILIEDDYETTNLGHGRWCYGNRFWRIWAYQFKSNTVDPKDLSDAEGNDFRYGEILPKPTGETAGI
jgi:hypothetical protein